MSLTLLIITALTVFFIWAGLVYPLISPLVGGPARTIVFSIIVFFIAFLVLRWPHPDIYFPMAVAGLVAVLHRWSGDYGVDAPVTVVRERPNRVPPNVPPNGV